MALERERVLIDPADVIRDRDPLRMCTHVAVLDRAPQAVMNGGIDQRGVPEAIPEPRTRHQIWREVHVLHPTRDDDLGIAGPDLRRGEHDRLETRSTDTVDRRCTRRDGETRRQRSLARRCLTHTGLQHLAHEDLVDRGRPG